MDARLVFIALRYTDRTMRPFRSFRCWLPGVLLVCFFSGVCVAAQITGYISDAACGWNNARPGKEAKECAEKCVRAGWDPVFVPDGQRETFKVSDKAKVLPYVGEHVVVLGELKGGQVWIKSIRRSSSRGSTARRTKGD